MTALRSRPLRTGLAALAGVTALILCFGFWGERVPVETAVASEQELVESLREEGRTRLVHRYRISAPVAGQTERIEWRPGDRVEAGEVLTRIHPASGSLWDPGTRDRLQGEARALAAAVEQAEARLRAAQAGEKLAASEAGRVQPLVTQGTLSRLEGDRAEASLAQARAERAAARYARDLARAQHEAALALLAQQGQTAANGTMLEVRAPIAGLVLLRLRESAGPVAVGEALLEIGDPSSLEIEVDLLSEDAVRVAPAMAVRLHRWGGAEALEARVRRVEPVGFTKVSALGVEEQRVLVIADFVSLPERWSRLGDAYRVEAEFILSSGRALTVPGGALFRRGEDWALFVTDGERSRERAVRVGRRNATHVEILEGLAAGDTVIVHPDDRVSEGTRIEELPAR